MCSPATEASFDVVVVGAGAAGQMAAIAAAQENRKVLLLEQMDQPGLKILASGGGRCNLSNLAGPEAFCAAFGKQGRFATAALAVMSPEELRRFLDRIGVVTIVDDDVRVYPASQRSADVQTALQRQIKRLGVELRLGCAVRRLWIDSGQLMGVEVRAGYRIAAARVVLACGGKSWPKLGGTGRGYALAQQAGLEITELLPALVPLLIQQRWTARLAGVSLRRVRLWIDLPGQDKTGLTGDLLFTHRGLSGPVTLDISGRVSELLRLGPVPLRIELVAGMDATQWTQRLEDWRSSVGGRKVANLLQDYLPRSFCAVLCELVGMREQTSVAHLTADNRDSLAKLLSGLELTVTSTEGFEVAFVTKGGVKLQRVDPNTLQSRSLTGLYLAGEMLDMDGPSCGFNLQWAFASGWLAGKSAAQR